MNGKFKIYLTIANCGDIKNIIPMPADVIRTDLNPSDICWVTARKVNIFGGKFKFLGKMSYLSLLTVSQLRDD